MIVIGAVWRPALAVAAPGSPYSDANLSDTCLLNLIVLMPFDHYSVGDSPQSVID